MTSAMGKYYNRAKPRPYSVFDTLDDLLEKKELPLEEALSEIISKLGPISERDVRAIAKRR